MRYEILKPNENFEHIYEERDTIYSAWGYEYDLVVRVFETGDFHIEINGGELKEYYCWDFTDTDDLIDKAWQAGWDACAEVDAGW